MIPDKIFLVGLPGSGKTTIGKLLSEHLGYAFIDLDEKIVEEEKQPITQIFEVEGEDYFRNVEHQQLLKCIQSRQSFVLSTGGGAPCFFDNMDQMNASGMTVFIDTPIHEIEKRLKADTSRPLMKQNTLEELSNKRIGWYNMSQKRVTSFDELKSFFLLY